MPVKSETYIAELRKRFSEYRGSHFGGQDNLFEHRVAGDAVVFKRDFAEHNLLIPQCSTQERAQIIEKIPHAKSRSRKSAQGDKWSFCLMAGTLCSANQERP